MYGIHDLYQLMERGWNITIECKGKGREYEMTFEASANKILTENMTKKEISSSMYGHIHCVGNTLKEIVDSLTETINETEMKL